MYKNNIHNSGYDFLKLCEVYPQLKAFVFENKYKTQTIDFANPEAVKNLNTALLFTHYNIKYWEFPEANLCPPIPGRVEYIHQLENLLKSSGINNNITVLDIGTGATCIYPLLGHQVYDWNFIATDIDTGSIEQAEKNIDKNELYAKIQLRYQEDKSQIFKGILKPTDTFSASICNPPFFRSEAEMMQATSKKLKGLGKNGESLRNFSGKFNELCYKGGEKAFVHTYLYESSLFKTTCFWYTTLVSKKENVKSIYVSLNKLGATEIKTIPMQLGNKTSRIVAWTFLTEDQQKKWNNEL
ncbi:23S rRNA (adenine(1618)-N(6))-methyltransferase RlmF [Flavobacteriaceae bacterium PRS1]|nr:23S rRNA (adenine(1618)-N(6))-methyltransferase RlmF [Flavobacteriaceae bacterium PRS1]